MKSVNSPSSTSTPESLPAIKTQIRTHYRAVREAKTPQEVRANSAALCRQLAEVPKQTAILGLDESGVPLLLRLPSVFMALLGIALMNVPGKEPLIRGLSSLSSALTRVSALVVHVAPLGVFAISASAAGS